MAGAMLAADAKAASRAVVFVRGAWLAACVRGETAAGAAPFGLLNAASCAMMSELSPHRSDVFCALLLLLLCIVRARWSGCFHNEVQQRRKKRTCCLEKKKGRKKEKRETVSHSRTRKTIVARFFFSFPFFFFPTKKTFCCPFIIKHLCFFSLFVKTLFRVSLITYIPSNLHVTPFTVKKKTKLSTQTCVHLFSEKIQKIRNLSFSFCVTD